MTPEEAHAINERLQRAYHMVFSSPDGKIVLADLAAYCHARITTFDAAARAQAFKEGKRDVFLRCQEFVGLSLEEIYQLRGGSRVKPTGDD